MRLKSKEIQKKTEQAAAGALAGRLRAKETHWCFLKSTEAQMCFLSFSTDWRAPVCFLPTPTRPWSALHIYTTPGLVLYVWGAPKHPKTTFLSKFRFLSEFRVCLNWGRVQTCPSRSGRFTTCTIFLSAGRTRRSGFFLVQIVLKVWVSSEVRKPALFAPYGGGAPIHTKPTQRLYGARYELLLPPWCPPTTHKPPRCVVMAD